MEQLDDALELAYGFDFAGIVFGPWQERTEIRRLLAAVEAQRPRRIVEIGTSNGGSLFLFARVATPDAVLISVDLPRGEFGGGYPHWRSTLYRSFAGDGQRIHLLRADSHQEETLGQVSAALGGEPIDFLFIDGDHTYEGVKRDFEMYEPLVGDGGLIALHDIVPATGRPDDRQLAGLAECDELYLGGDVPAFWADLKRTHEVEEIVADRDSGKFGIGVVRKGTTARAG